MIRSEWGGYAGRRRCLTMAANGNRRGLWIAIAVAIIVIIIVLIALASCGGGGGGNGY
ncbi:hypothetical protein GCM10009848_25300 [Micromonospora lupini]